MFGKFMSSLAITSRSFSKHPFLRQEILKLYPDAKFNDNNLSLSGDSLIQFLQGYDKAITALEVIDSSILSKLPDLKVIGKFGVGLDMIDLHAMDKFDVKLGWTGGVNKRSVSELVISFSISLLHRAAFANAEVKNGKWYQVKGRQLSDCTFGIIGCGHIGKDLVRLLKPFNCTILVHDILDYKDFYRSNNLQAVSLDDLLKKSDVVSLHLPQDESTENILNRDRLHLLKKDAVIINLARGRLIDESSLKNILNEGRIAGAALDVFAEEPPITNDFALMDNVIVTPHIGGSTEEAIIAMGVAAINGLTNPRNALDFE
jgi:phosphoglycerate dehydrogenase-like enzyme